MDDASFCESNLLTAKSRSGLAVFNGGFSTILTVIKLLKYGFFGGYFTGLLDTLYLTNNIYS